jgi:4-amino-4-deoxy-L-arabinose transferase-like glycosyltransferase
MHLRCGKVVGMSAELFQGDRLSARQVRTTFWWIACAGLAVRLLWAWLVPVDPVSDSVVYDRLAVRLAEGLGYTWEDGAPTAFWPVGASAFYAGLYSLFGQSHVAAIASHLVLYLAILAGTMALAARWFGGPAATVAGALLAVWPIHIQFTTIIASELIFTALLIGMFVAWEAKAIGWLARAMILGALFAAASYVRPTAMLMPAILFTAAVIQGRDWRHALKVTLTAALLAAALVAPWSMRNTAAFGQFVAISTNGGATLWMGNNPDSTGGYMGIPEAYGALNEAERDDRLGQIAKAYIRDQPLRFVANSAWRLFDTFNRETVGIAWNEQGLVERYGSGVLLPLKGVSQLFWLTVLGLAAAGWIVLFRRQGWRSVLGHPATLTIGYFATVHAVIVSQDRYHFPLTPLIAMFAAVALLALTERAGRSRRHRARPAPIAV